ncbi:IPT/TIG domain-containing protein [Streptomyces lydicus]|uniref:IPT/TIG domain-containing protein n=1 Tax=Streptomyces lydicus TaxID=47763 RepID=UPI0037A28A07
METNEPLVADEIPVGHAPIVAAITPDGRHVYVTNFGGSSVSVIDTTTRRVITTISVTSGPWGVTVAPDGLRAYVACFGTDSVAVIDTTTRTATVSIPGLNKPLGLTVSPDGSRLYVASQGGNRVDVISTATDTVIASVPVGAGPRNVAVTPDGTEVYVTEEGANAVAVIDTATHSVVDTITGLPIPFGLAVSHDGLLVYVARDGDDSVSAIDLTKNKIIDTVPGFHAPSWPVVTPDDLDVYVVNNGNETVSVLPTPSGAYPDAGPMSGGTPVDIIGEGLGNTTAVLFGCQPAASFTILNDREILAVSPRLATDVKIDATIGQDTTRTVGRFYFLPDSVLTKISPTSGPLSGGGTLTVTGRGLITTTSVRFGTVAVTPSSVLDDKVTVTVPPAEATGPVPVTVVTRSNSYGRSTFTYVGPPGITSVSPSLGSSAGGDPVLIVGTELASTQSVTIGGAAADFGVLSDTRIAAVTPPAATLGPANVTVTTTGGTATAPGAFVYI